MEPWFILFGMREMKLDSTHDIQIQNGHIVRIATDSGQDLAKKVAQAAECMLKTEEGEAFTDRRHGCPWFGRILGLPVVHLDVAKGIIKKKLQAVEGVEKVQRVVIDCDGRNISGSFSLQCEDGTTAAGEF